MNATVVFESLFDANQHLRSQAVISAENWRADYCGESRVNEHLSADDDKDALFLWVLSRRVRDAIHLPAFHRETWYAKTSRASLLRRCARRLMISRSRAFNSSRASFSTNSQTADSMKSERFFLYCRARRSTTLTNSSERVTEVFTFIPPIYYHRARRSTGHDGSERLD